MKAVLFAVLLAAHMSQALADPGAIYRCGNEYLNDATVAQARGCSIVEGGAGSVTVTGTRAQFHNQTQVRVGSAASASDLSALTSTTPRPTSWRTDIAEQRARDRDALSILQAELGKAEALMAERQRELADPKRHASRLGELQSSISRHLSDIAGLKREISRLPVQSK